MARKRTFAPKLTETEMELLLEALDSHAYWQLADEQYRDNGYVIGKGSRDEENRDALKATSALHEKLSGVMGQSGGLLEMSLLED